MAAAMGLGGGTFLIVYLTIFAGVSQTAAQGINLVFFLPTAALALVFHIKNKLVDVKKIAPAIITGAIMAAVFAAAANKIDERLLRKLFGAFLLIMGMKTMCQSFRVSSRKPFSCGGSRDNPQE